MTAEQPLEHQTRVGVSPRLRGAGYRHQRVVTWRVVRPPAPVANTIQADVRGDPVEQTRWIARIELPAPLDDPDEHVLTGIERVFFSSERTRSAPRRG